MINDKSPVYRFRGTQGIFAVKKNIVLSETLFALFFQCFGHFFQMLQQRMLRFEI